eukprot:g234.t1
MTEKVAAPKPTETTTAPKMKQYSLEEIKKHNTEDDCWIAIHGKVYDLTKFLDDHPGGPDVMTDEAGTDGTGEFENVGHSEGAREQLAEYLIGEQKDYVPTWSDDGSDSGVPMWLFPLLAIVVGILYKVFVLDAAA